MLQASVIIPVYNDAERLELCLGALANQTVPAGEFEVIVVDNGSDQPPRALVESYPFCRFAEEARPGSYAARNRGLQLATANAIAFTDADCLPEPGWLAAGLKALDGISGLGLVGGRIKVFPRDEQAATPAELFDVLYGFNQRANVERWHAAATANAFTTRAVFDAVGLFNAAQKSGGDIEWGQRVHQAGMPVVWCEAATIRHPARREVRALVLKARRHAGGRIDKRRSKASGLLRLRDAYNAIRLVAPPLGRFGDIARRLRQRGAPSVVIGQVCWIAWRIRLTALVEGARTAMGRVAERR